MGPKAANCRRWWGLNWAGWLDLGRPSDSELAIDGYQLFHPLAWLAGWLLVAIQLGMTFELAGLALFCLGP